MLRRTVRCHLMEGIHYRIPDVATLPVLVQDIDPATFHQSCMPGLYQEVSNRVHFSKCEKLFNRRIIVAVPCSIGKKCLRVPMLVDTGAPSTYLHTIALNKFFGVGNPVPGEFDAYIGTHLLRAKHNPDVSTTTVTGNLNILGMDFLDSAVPDLLPWLSDRLSAVQKDELIPVWVQQRDRSGAPVGPAFEVSPAKNHVDALKDSIKAKLEANDKSLTVNALKMMIYAPGSSEVAKPSLPLSETTDDVPFYFVLP